MKSVPHSEAVVGVNGIDLRFVNKAHKGCFQRETAIFMSIVAPAVYWRIEWAFVV